MICNLRMQRFKYNFQQSSFSSWLPANCLNPSMSWLFLITESFLFKFCTYSDVLALTACSIHYSSYTDEQYKWKCSDPLALRPGSLGGGESLVTTECACTKSPVNKPCTIEHVDRKLQSRELKPSMPLEDLLTDYPVALGTFQYDAASLSCFLAHYRTVLR